MVRGTLALPMGSLGTEMSTIHWTATLADIMARLQG